MNPTPITYMTRRNLQVIARRKFVQPERYSTKALLVAAINAA